MGLVPLPEPGQTAPDFTLPAADGTPVTLSELRGTWVDLYFYPKASTPGQTYTTAFARGG
jgi:peroxiredoxin Q/BCP